MESHTLEVGEHLLVGSVRLTVLAAEESRVILGIRTPEDGEDAPRWVRPSALDAPPSDN